MKKLIILLILVLAIPVIAQQPEAKYQWVLDDLSKVAIQAFYQRYSEDKAELMKIIKKAEMRMNPDMPAGAVFNEQLQAFVILKPKEEKKDDGKQ